MTTSGCWEWAGTIQHGYGKLMLAGRNIRAHRLAYETWIGPIPEGYLVMHSCDNPPCINPAHLSLGTPLDNMRDKVVKGRHRFAVGVNCGSSRLTPETVVAMRIRRSRDGLTYQAIADEFNISLNTAWNAVVGNTWREVIDE